MKLGETKAWAGSKEDPDTIIRTARKRISDIKMKLVDFVVVIPKSDEEIVIEVNELAIVLARKAGWVHVFASDPKELLVNMKDRRAQGFWSAAAAIYEHLTGTEVHDAVQSVNERNKDLTNG